MHGTEKTIKWIMVLIIIFGATLIILSQPPIFEYKNGTAELTEPHGNSEAHGERADNATPINITSIPKKATGDFLIEVGISESTDIDISDVMLWSSDDMITWTELPLMKYRPALNDTIVVQGSQLDDGTVHLGVSRSNALGPDNYGTVEISTPKNVAVSETNEIFEPGLAMYVIIIVAIGIFGGGALIYKGGTDQIKGMMRQIHKDERMKASESGSRNKGYDHEGGFVGARHQDPDHRSEKSSGRSYDDDDDAWEEEPAGNDISWGEAGDEGPRNRRRRGRDEARERWEEESGDDEIAWGEADAKGKQGKGRGRQSDERRGSRKRGSKRERDDDEVAWGGNNESRNRRGGRYGRDSSGQEGEDGKDRYGSRGERSGRRGGESRGDRGNEAPKGRRGTSTRKEERGGHVRKTGSEKMRGRDERRDRGGRTRRRRPRSAYGKKSDGSGDDYQQGSRRYGRKDEDMSWLN